jgi:acyl-CoA hydrolase
LLSTCAAELKIAMPLSERPSVIRTFQVVINTSLECELMGTLLSQFYTKRQVGQTEGDFRRRDW